MVVGGVGVVVVVMVVHGGGLMVTTTENRGLKIDRLTSCQGLAPG